jgi:hypothetical protein
VDSGTGDEVTTPIAAIAVDGVLRDVESLQPIRAGQRLYEALRGFYSIVLIADTPVDERWLIVHGFGTKTVVLKRAAEDPEDPIIRRTRQIEKMRGVGRTVEMLIDSDPYVIAAASKLGIVCLHYVDPPYARPEFHPSFVEEITPWDQMVEQIELDRIKRAEDTRMAEDEE